MKGSWIEIYKAEENPKISTKNMGHWEKMGGGVQELGDQVSHSHKGSSA